MKADFNIKEVFRKNGRFLLATLMLFILLIAGGIYLGTRAEFHGDNPITQVDENRSQILVTGEKYSLSQEQEQEYIEQEQIREEIKNENREQIEEQSGITQNENSDNSEGKPDGGNGQSGGDGAQGENTDDGKENSKKPRIECSLINGQNVSGNYLSFNVKATSYKKVVISAFDMFVTINGTRVRSSGTSGSGWVTFKDDGTLINGANTIVIKATDADGNTADVTYVVNVDANAERPKNGSATVIVDAPSIGLGTLFTRELEIYEGENVSAVMLRAFESSGYKASFRGSINHGFYLERVFAPGIMNGWTSDRLHPAVKKNLEDINASETGYKGADSLGEKDLYGFSGWVVSYNGVYGDAMSTVPCEDQDVIRLSFSVHLGYEYNGGWPDCNL